jgi:hypothetical protein
MARETLGERLRREAYEYLADLRTFAEALKRAEGWFTLALILAVLFMVAVWFVTGLGFDRLSQAASALGAPRGKACKPVQDFDALVMILNAMLMFLLAIVSLGEMMLLLDRVHKGQAREPRKVAGPAALMLVVGIAGIAYMRYVC